MTGRSNYTLFNGKYATYGTLFTIGKTVHRTGCGGAGYCNFCMSLCRDYFLLYKSIATYGTLLAVLQTSFSTCCSLALYDLLGVSLHRNFFLLKSYNTTYGAMLTFLKTGFGTSGSLSFVNNLGMSLCRNCFGFIISALTSKLLGTCTKTGCGGNNLLGEFVRYLFVNFVTLRALIPVVSLIVLRNCVFVSCVRKLLLNYVFTYGTDLCLILSRSFNIGSMCRVVALDATAVCTYVPVAVCIRRPSRSVIVTKLGVFIKLRIGFITSVTLRGLGAVCFTGSVTVSSILSEGVILCRDYFLL